MNTLCNWSFWFLFGDLESPLPPPRPMYARASFFLETRHELTVSRRHTTTPPACVGTMRAGIRHARVY